MAIILMTGYTLIKVRLANPEHTPILSTLLLYVFVPCIGFNSFMMPYSAEMFKVFIFAMAGGVFAQIFFIFLAWLVKKSPFKADPTEQACLAYTNCGNLLLPLISGLLSSEYVFYSSAFMAANIICLWTHLPSLFAGRFKPDIKKILLNPNIIAIALGIIFFSCNLQLPAILADTVSTIGGSTGVLSMLVTGMLLAEIDLRSVIMSMRCWAIFALRLIVFPLILIAVIFISGLAGSSEAARAVLLVIVMGGAAPTATGVINMSALFGGRAEFASAISAITTLLCIITLPVIVYIYQIVC